MINLITNVLGWIVKNTALLVGIIEALAKVIGGIISMTPTKKDDNVLPIIDKVFSTIKKLLYSASDFLGQFGKSSE